MLLCLCSAGLLSLQRSSWTPSRQSEGADTFALGDCGSAERVRPLLAFATPMAPARKWLLPRLSLLLAIGSTGAACAGLLGLNRGIADGDDGGISWIDGALPQEENSDSTYQD